MSDFKELVKQARDKVTVIAEEGKPKDYKFSDSNFNGSEVSETGAPIWKNKWWGNMEEADGFHKRLKSNINKNK